MVEFLDFRFVGRDLITVFRFRYRRNGGYYVMYSGVDALDGGIRSVLGFYRVVNGFEIRFHVHSARRSAGRAAYAANSAARTRRTAYRADNVVLIKIEDFLHGFGVRSDEESFFAVLKPRDFKIFRVVNKAEIDVRRTFRLERKHSVAVGFVCSFAFRFAAENFNGGVFVNVFAARERYRAVVFVNVFGRVYDGAKQIRVKSVVVVVDRVFAAFMSTEARNVFVSEFRRRRFVYDRSAVLAFHNRRTVYGAGRVRDDFFRMFVFAGGRFASARSEGNKRQQHNYRNKKRSKFFHTCSPLSFVYSAAVMSRYPSITCG